MEAETSQGQYGNRPRGSCARYRERRVCNAHNSNRDIHICAHPVIERH